MDLENINNYNNFVSSFGETTSRSTSRSRMLSTSGLIGAKKNSELYSTLTTRPDRSRTIEGASAYA